MEFVATTWQTLIPDLEAGKFDVAMSGVSRKLFRQRVGFFSVSYHLSGKSAITRWEKGQRFSTLKAIDQKGVKVIVNPGGTNERFVRSKIKNATIVLHPDNHAIFKALFAKKADVMITDRIEIEVTTKRYKSLCKASGQLFSSSIKAWLMMRDMVLKEYVDLFLSELEATGELKTVFDSYVGS